MSETLQSPRGTRDILPDEQPLWQLVRRTAQEVAEQFAFQPITTPTYEDLRVFERAIGGGTDVMDKELFLTRGTRSEEGEGTEYALRPEGTAGIVRAFIQHGMHTWPQPVRLFTFVNNFRYDRPQKGRYREHVQFDLEAFGETSPFADAWIIAATWQFLSRLEIKGLILLLNTLGTSEERANYSKALQEYLEPLKEQLSSDSLKRLTLNTLRILDSKDAGDQKVLLEAPRLLDFLSLESKAHFEAVQNYLKYWNIPFKLDSALVRGLDYYSHTAFEWIVEGSAGQQASLGGGGRYDGLVTQLGGPSTVGAVGAGIGLDRVVEELAIQQAENLPSSVKPEVFILCAGPEALQRTLQSRGPLRNRAGAKWMVL